MVHFARKWCNGYNGGSYDPSDECAMGWSVWIVFLVSCARVWAAHNVLLRTSTRAVIWEMFVSLPTDAEYSFDRILIVIIDVKKNGPFRARVSYVMSRSSAEYHRPSPILHPPNIHISSSVCGIDMIRYSSQSRTTGLLLVGTL